MLELIKNLFQSKQEEKTQLEKDIDMNYIGSKEWLKQIELNNKQYM